MYYMNDALIESVVDKYSSLIVDGEAVYIKSDEAVLAPSTTRYALSFLSEAGIVYEQVTPQVDGVCCLRLKDPLVGYLLHFVEEEFHIFMDANLKECLQPQVIFWYLMTLKVEQGVIPLEVLYSQFGSRIQKIPKQRHWYEVRTIVGGRILAKGDHGFCQKSITCSGNACLGVTHYLVPAYVEHEKFMKKIRLT